MKEEKIIAAKDEEMNARIKKQEITSKIESEIRMLNDEVSQTIYRIRKLSSDSDCVIRPKCRDMPVFEERHPIRLTLDKAL